MTRMKKKKNYKLRRQIKRTVAALMMVMAVVVAAVPVENLGTVGATYVNGDVYEALKTEYGKVTKTPVTIPTYTGTTVEVQRITNGVLSKPFEVVQNGKTAIISKYTGGARDNDFVIDDTEYYGYVLMDSNYIEKLKSEMQM